MLLVKRYLHVWLLLLSVLCDGWVIPRDSGRDDGAVILTEQELFTKHRLMTRDSTNCALEVSDPDTPLCRALCAPSSYSCYQSPVQRRFVGILNGWADSELWNSTAARNLSRPKIERDDSRVKTSLNKRVITQLNQGDVATYLPAQFTNNYDRNFGPGEGLILDDGDDTTVVRQKNLGTTAFQVGSNGLHGCTIITVVSTRAVYMGHFWEVGAWSSGTTAFNERVLNWFSDGGRRAGDGPAFNPNLFNGANDKTRVYIMAPRRTNSPNNPKQTNYRTKLPQVITAIKNRIGNQNVPLALYNYIPLEYANPDDRAQINQNQRGIAVFQFDPSARGTNSPGWRLLYEQHQFQDTDDPPGADAATGIPDL